ncbi:MAG: hypothetical protein CMB22_01290 [Euryarchaeota archaeon]|nr:hypothetical protein [Euryarchaeota archaeon]
MPFKASDVRGKQFESGQGSSSTCKHPESGAEMTRKITASGTLTSSRGSSMLMKACNRGHNNSENGEASLLYGTT